MSVSEVEAAKQALRESTWRRLLAAGVVPQDSYGTIPDYDGASHAARRLARLDLWRHAYAVKANPDYAQRDVRARAVTDGKLLYMAVPRMASLRPFQVFDPEVSGSQQADAQQGPGGGAALVGVEDMRHIDVVVCGSVAVNRSGARLGKGAGYSDLEVALLLEGGLVTNETVIVSLVHDLQVLDEEIPETDHDFSVDYIITPEEVIRCPNPRRPAGLIWAHLTSEKIEAIPALRARSRGGH